MLFPSMLDASILSSRPHYQAIVETSSKTEERFRLSAKLYEVLYKSNQFERKYEILSYFRYLEPSELLPIENLSLAEYVEPYAYDREYVADIMGSAEKANYREMYRQLS